MNSQPIQGQKQKGKEVYAFIDSQNLNVTTKKLGWNLDWAKFRVFLTEKYGVTKAYMFIGYVPEFESLYEQMHQAGYAIVLKPTFDMTRVRVEESPESKNDEEKKPTKGNIDADLVLWAMKEMPKYNQAVLVSGDGDFYSLVEYLIEKHRLLKLLTPSGHYSRLFNAFDEKFIDRLDTHRRELEYRTFKRKQKKT